MIKAIIIGFVCLFSIGTFLTLDIKKQTEIKVEHVAEVPQTVFPDGRYQAGEPEHYLAHPSPAIIWEITGETSKGFRLAGVIVLALVVLYIGFCASGAITYKHGYFFAGLAASAALWFAAYSSALEQNPKKLTPAQYEAVKGDLKSLWNKDNLIR